MIAAPAAPMPAGWKDLLKCTNPLDVAGCGSAAKDAAGATGKAVASSSFKGMVKDFLESTVGVLEKLSTFWLKVPDPTVANQKVTGGNVAGTTLAGPLEVVADKAAPAVAFVAVIVVLVQCMMAVLRMSGEPLLAVGRQMAAIVVVQGTLAAFVQLSLQIGDIFSEEILTLPGLSDKGLAGLLVVSQAMGTKMIGLWLILAILAILGSVMQLMFMMLRGPLIILMVLAVHIAAALAAGDAGTQRLRRGCGLLLSFIIYKPVAAIIYATGFMLIYGVDGEKGVKGGDVIMNTLYGFTVILLAAIALPAVIKFVDPVAASTGSSLFSGAVAAGAVAGGAALMASGGSAAAAGAAGSAGRSGGSAVEGATESGGGSGGGTGGGVPGGGSSGGEGGSGGTGGGSSGGEGGSGGGTGGGVPGGGSSGAGSQTGGGGIPEGGAAASVKDGGSNGPGGSGGKAPAGAQESNRAGHMGTATGIATGPESSGSKERQGLGNGPAGGPRSEGGAAPGAQSASGSGPAGAEGGRPAGGAGGHDGPKIPAWGRAAVAAGRAGHRAGQVSDEAMTTEGSQG